MTDELRATPESSTASGRVIRIVLNVLTAVLLLFAVFTPFLTHAWASGARRSVSSYDVVADPFVLQNDGSSAPLLRVGFVGLLAVLALLVVLLVLTALAKRVRGGLRGIGLTVGALGIIGSVVVLLLTAFGSRDGISTPGVGGVLLLIGTIAATALIAAAPGRRAGTRPSVHGA